jgi:glycosyltransferase involved in cell wall biosynthesis
MKFSIVIGAYNAADTISRCIDSLLAQAFDPRAYEIIVVDDGSTDATARIAQSCAAGQTNVRVIVHQENTGPAGARNTALAAATGDVVISFDADCTAAPNWLAALERAYRDNPTASGVAGWLTNGADSTLLDRYLNLSGYGNPSRLLEGREGGPFGRLRAYFKNNFLFHEPDGYYQVHHAYGANASFHTELLRAVGGWNPVLRASEDTDLAERIRRAYPRRPIIGTPHAHLTHHHDMTIRSYLGRAVRRGPAVLSYYRYNHIIPPVFPGPFGVAGLAIIALVARAAWLLPFLPLICYPWHVARFVATHKVHYLAFTYLEWVNESLTIVGLIYGAAKLGGIFRKVPSHG